MEMHQIRYFLSVTKTLNFTRAAEDCNVSQPALSRAIQQLEGELGADLFRRERSHTHITEFGRVILPALQQCYDAGVQAKALAQEFRKAGHAPFNLALARTIDLEQFTSVLGEVASAFPRIEINIVRGTPIEIAEKLKNGDVEIAIAESFDDGWDRFEIRRLFEEKFGLLINGADPLAQGDWVELGDLANTRLLCRPQCAMTELLNKKLQEAGIAPPLRHEVPLVEDLAGMVRARLGVAVWPASRKVTAGLNLAEVRDCEMASWIQLYSVFGRPHSTAAATFIRLMRGKDWGIGFAAPPAAPDATVEPETVH